MKHADLNLNILYISSHGAVDINNCQTYFATQNRNVILKYDRY